MRPLLLALSLLLAVIALPRAARAQPIVLASQDWRALGDGVIAVETTASSDGAHRGTVTLRRLDGRLAPAGAPVAVYSGPEVGTAMAVRDGAAAILLFGGSARPFVKVALVDLGSRAVRVVDLARTAGPDYAPTAAVACADADGFTLLWQEQKRGDRGAEARSTLARVKADGAVRAAPAAVPVPWSLAAIVDDGRGYTLAVNFDGAAPDQTRLCFVTLTRDGRPEQHPWWGSRPDVVNDVQLVIAGGRVTAVYRGGARSGSLLAVVADRDTGKWGVEAPPSRPLAARLAPDAPFAVRVKDGGVEIVKR